MTTTNTTRNWDKLSRLRDDIVSMVERRDEIIASKNLDVSFCLPDGNWHCDSNNDYLDKYRQLRDCPIEDVPNTLFPLSASHRGPWTEGTYDLYVKFLLHLGFKPIDGLNILEIGAGHGGLADRFLRMLDAYYVICDIPESLLFSGLYLALSGYHVSPMGNESFIHKSSVRLVPNYYFHHFVESFKTFDLVINTLSMSEMSEHQVRVYAAGISKLIGNTGVFFELNYDNRNHDWGRGLGHGINAKDYIVDYFSGSVDMKVNVWHN